MSKQLRPVPIQLEGPNVFEEWRAGSYVVTVLFPIRIKAGEQLRQVDEIEAKAVELLETAKKLKKGIWPRGIASFHLIPLYILEESEFSADLHRDVHNRSQYWKYAVYLDPVLCELATGRVTLRFGFENARFLLTKFFMRVLLSSLTQVGTLPGAAEIKAFDVNKGTLRLPLAR